MSMIPSHDVARWLLYWIDNLLEWIGLGRKATIEEFVYVIAIVIIAIAVGWFVRVLAVFLIERVVRLRKFEIWKEVISRKLFTKVSHIIPPLIFLALIPFAFATEKMLLLVLIKGMAIVYLSITIGVAICAFLSFVWDRYDSRKNNENHPLRGVLNVAKGVVWILVLIISVSTLLDKSPIVLLTGLGAFAAALMLVFRDSILGFVAGLQLSQNDMLRVGDWIVVPSTLANGIVEDVSLTVVKVRNWDNTMVMLPPYTLVSTSFQNWRGMLDSNVRLISKTILIETNSIHSCDADFLNEMIKEFPQLVVIVDRKDKYEGGLVVINGSAETNLGLFRAYLCDYLIKHQMISSNWQILVNLLTPDRDGMPLQIYCYANTTDWTMYEAIQSEIMEHVISIAPKFRLSICDMSSLVDLT